MLHRLDGFSKPVRASAFVLAGLVLLTCLLALALPPNFSTFVKGMLFPIVLVAVVLGVMIHLERKRANEDMRLRRLARDHVESGNPDPVPTREHPASESLSEAIEAAMRLMDPSASGKSFSVEALGRMDWLWFERLAAHLFRSGGMRAEPAGIELDGSVVMELRSERASDDIPPQAIVHCLVRAGSAPGADSVRRIAGAMEARQVSRGILLCNRTFSVEAVQAARQVQGLLLGDAEWILKRIDHLPLEERERLEAEFLRKEFDVPSCPTCEIKLSRRGDSWVCPNSVRGCRTVQPAEAA